METKISENQILIKVCCVIASFVLWLYIFNVENPVRQRKITVPVKIVNTSALAQSNFVQEDNKNLSVSLDLKGNASDVFSVKAEDFKLECDLSSYVMKKGDNNIPVKVIKSPNNVSIVNNQNLWVGIKLDKLVKKTMPIKLLIDGKAENGLYVSTPVSQIKKAEVSGASNYVNSVDTITARYNIKNISKYTTVNVVLQAEDSYGNVIKNVSINPKTVQVTIPVKNVKNVPVNIKTTGKVSDQIDIKSIVASPANVDISGDNDVISSISSIDTEPVDLSQISSSKSIDAKLIVPGRVKLVSSSGYVRLNISIDETRTTKAEKTSEKTFNTKIQIENIDGYYNAELDDNNVIIVVSGDDQIIKNLNEDDIKCFVDLKSITEGQNDLPLNVTLPKGVSLISKNPQTVKVTVSKKISEDENVN